MNKPSSTPFTPSPPLLLDERTDQNCPCWQPKLTTIITYVYSISIKIHPYEDRSNYKITQPFPLLAFFFKQLI